MDLRVLLTPYLRSICPCTCPCHQRPAHPFRGCTVNVQAISAPRNPLPCNASRGSIETRNHPPLLLTLRQLTQQMLHFASLPLVHVQRGHTHPTPSPIVPQGALLAPRMAYCTCCEMGGGLESPRPFHPDVVPAPPRSARQCLGLVGFCGMTTLTRFPFAPRGAAGKLRRAANRAPHISDAAVMAARTPLASTCFSCLFVSPSGSNPSVASCINTVPRTPKTRGEVDHHRCDGLRVLEG